ncbi:MAG: hypothetical protein ACXQTS_03370 [Candidatus Methanospirareceae archaeon]
MSEIKPIVRTIKDVGYRVIMRNEDGSPRQILKCFIKEGAYGKFISVESHWVQRMEGGEIAETKWARRSYSFPYDKKKALEYCDFLKELVEEAFKVEKEEGGEVEEIEEFEDIEEIEEIDEL